MTTHRNHNARPVNPFVPDPSHTASTLNESGLRAALDTVFNDGRSTLSVNAWQIARHALSDAGTEGQIRMALAMVFNDPTSDLSPRSWDAAHAALRQADNS